MSNAGKYVRAPEYETDSDESDFDERSVRSCGLEDPGASDFEQDGDELSGSASDSDLPPKHDQHANVDNDNDSTSTTEENINRTRLDQRIEDRGSAEEQPVAEVIGRRSDASNAELYEKMEKFEKALSSLAAALDSNQRHQYVHDLSDAELSWNTARTQMACDGPTQSIRWDHIKVFPKDIPANKLWEAWNKYMENFEIAASLGNAFEPSRRAQLLFLSMGEEMQAIIRAAKLRPSLEDADCYAKFVSNIDSYLKSMTDTSAEHESFSNMRQGKEESVMGFHARLVEKVRLCGYGTQDQERFVRAQLIKGMSNQMLAKSARTYGHETNYIVQSATREEAFDREAGPLHQADVFALDGQRYSRHEPPPKRKRTSSTDRRGVPQARTSVRGTTHTPGRRARCSRCYYTTHRNETCPALLRNCNKCGQRGHFAAACRPKHVSRQDQWDENSSDFKHHAQVKFDRKM